MDSDNSINNLSVDHDGFTTNNLKRDLASLMEKNEILVQENYALKKKIELLEKISSELENELTVLNNANSQEKKELQNVHAELVSATAKITYLESQLEEERRNLQMFVEETNLKNSQEPLNTSPQSNHVEHINILSTQIENLQNDQEKDKELIDNLKHRESVINMEKEHLKEEKATILYEIEDLKKHLAQKGEEVQKLKESLETAREEKMIVTTELQMLKATDSTAERGNSIFGELEENRQKAVAQRELMKIKYINLKKAFSQKQVENNKLKLEIAKIRREEIDDEKNIRRDYVNLIETYKDRVSELEEQIKSTERSLELPAIENVEGENVNLKWVDTVVENARKETKMLKDELEKRASNYVFQAHQLFDSQKQNRKLKSTIAKMQADIDELKLNLEVLKSAPEDIKDGISPPAVETIIALKKKVSFREVLKENTNSAEETSMEEVGIKHESEEVIEKNTGISDIKEENEDKENV